MASADQDAIDEAFNEAITDQNPIKLTDEEINELEKRPASTKWQDFTEEQFNLRLQIAKKFCQFFLDIDDTLDEDRRMIYEKYPLWGFYKSGMRMNRIYGVGYCSPDGKIESVDKKNEDSWMVHTVTCHICITNDVIGGTPCKELIQLDRWTDDDLKYIKLNDMPGVFADPLGFMVILESKSE